MSKADERAKERYWLEPCNIDTQNKYHAYVEGYHQAEKDLELKWEDMFNIFRLVNEVLDDYADGKTKKEVGEEILKRFKEGRNERPI